MEDETLPVTEKYIRVIPDYMSNGIWHRNGIHAEPDELPVSDSCVRDRPYGRTGTTSATISYPSQNARTVSTGVAFTKEGLAIAFAIKAALPDWTVVWLDEQKLGEAIRSTGKEWPARRFSSLRCWLTSQGVRRATHFIHWLLCVPLR
jgi:hypothetical protein